MKKRNSGMDLLRCIAMLFIIIHHIIVDNYGLRNMSIMDFQRPIIEKVILIIINAIVIVGVNLFFLSSGYFSIELSRIKIEKIIYKIYLIIWCVMLIGVLIKSIRVDSFFWKFIFDPIDEYWYLAVYIFLMLLSPLVNLVIKYMDKKIFRYFLIIFTGLFCVYGLLRDVNLHLHRGYSLLMAIALYIIGGGIAKFNLINRNVQNKTLFGIYVLINFINALAIILVDFTFGDKFAWLMYGYNQPFIVLQSILLLLLFKNLIIRRELLRKIITFLAKGTLSTYLLHCTCWIGNYRGKVIEYFESRFGFLGSLIIILPYAIIIFMVCASVDFIYELIVKKLKYSKKLLRK